VQWRRCRTLGWVLEVAAVSVLGAILDSSLRGQPTAPRGPFQDVPVISRAIMERLA
jgi:hypothetical protein